jgi:hypothetical protein
MPAALAASSSSKPDASAFATPWPRASMKPAMYWASGWSAAAAVFR